MLIIGHRGAAGTAPENTLESLAQGFLANADMLEFDIRATKDGIPILYHDPHLARTHKRLGFVGSLTLEELQKRTAGENPIATLEDVLDLYFGKILLNIEIKSRGAGKVAVELIAKKYIKKQSDWDMILFSSFKALELRSMRKTAVKAQLALLHGKNNQFAFLAFHRSLRLTAVGFHRLYINDFSLEIARRCGIFTYVYTVNRTKTAGLMEDRGIDWVVTDYPDLLLAFFKKRNKQE